MSRWIAFLLERPVLVFCVLFAAYHGALELYAGRDASTPSPTTFMTHQHLILAAIIGLTLTSLSAIAGAVYLASRGLSGWGWLIFLAVVVSTSFSLSVSPKGADGSSAATTTTLKQ